MCFVSCLRLGCISLVVVASSFVGAPDARACTAFMAEHSGAPVIGKSYDWEMGQGLVIVNKQGVQKQGIAVKSGDKPAAWVSKYMSVTFNQFGREFPNGGMNEAGLVVEVLWLNATDYAPTDDRPSLNELQWIQYQLDSYATVAEAVAAADRVRISSLYAKVHYFMCDEGGACAVFEVLDGKMTVTSGDALTFKAVTNNTYAESVAYAAKFEGLGGDKKPKSGTSSLDRFVRAITAAKTLGDADTAHEGAFRLLDSVLVSGRTRWQIVYLPVDGRVYFRTTKEQHVKSIDLAKLDGSCATPVKMVDIDYAAEGNITSTLESYVAAENTKLVKKTVGVYARKIPAGTVDKAARTPETFVCTPAVP